MSVSERLFAAGLEQLSGSVGQIRADAQGRLAQIEQRLAGVERTGHFCIDALDHALQKIDAANEQRVSDRQDQAQRELRTQRKMVELEERTDRVLADLGNADSGQRLEQLERKLSEALGLLKRSHPADNLAEAFQALSHRLVCLEKDHGDLATQMRAAKPIHVDPLAMEEAANTVEPPPFVEPAEYGDEASASAQTFPFGTVPDFEDIFAPSEFETSGSIRAPIAKSGIVGGSKSVLLLAAIILVLMGISLIAGLTLPGRLARAGSQATAPGSASAVAHIPEPPGDNDLDPGFLSTQESVGGQVEEGQATRDPAPQRAAASRPVMADADALAVLGSRNLDGDAATPVNYVQALRFLTQAAELGQAVAQYRLGTMYELGRGMPVDLVKAAHWYELSAGQGNRKAMHNLGVLYSRGTAVPKNMPLAVTWFARAAALGLADSQFNLAVLYERGDSVPQSLREAYKWYSIAAARGDVESRNRVSVLQSQLPDADKKAAEIEIASFHPVRMIDSANVVPGLDHPAAQ